MDTVSSSIKDLSIAVVGDFFLDEFLYIDINRTVKSNYTDCDAFYVERVKRYAGAAGTIAKNLANLGVGKIYAIGIVGDDGNGLEVRKALDHLNIDCTNLYTELNFCTPKYTMIIHRNGNVAKEVCEYDLLTQNQLPSNDTKIIRALQKLVQETKVDAIIALDQYESGENGTITSSVVKALSQLGESTVVLLDSRRHKEITNNVILKCNYSEFTRSVLFNKDGSINSLLRSICNETNRPVIVTKDKEGAFIGTQNEVIWIPPKVVDEPVDTRGAGDAFTCGFIVAHCCGLSFFESGTMGAIMASSCVKQFFTTGYMPYKDVLRIFQEGGHGE